MAAGIRTRHSRACASRHGKRCNCSPSYEAWVYSKRDDKKIRKTFSLLAEAKAWRSDAGNALNCGRLRAPTATTLKDAAAEFLAGAEQGAIPTRSGGRYKPATLRSYRRALDARILPVLGAQRLTELQRRDVQDLADELTGQGLSASTIQNTLDPLRVIYRRAIRRDLVSVDPTEGLELRRPKGQRDRIASPAEAVELLAVLPDLERALWATAMYAGLRRGELRALRWADIDLPAKVVHVQRGWDDIEGEQDGKSAAAERDVPILEPLARELAAYKLRSGRGGEALVFGLTAADPFFPSTVRDHALAAWAAENERRRKLDPEAATLAPIGLHKSRHTCASVLIASGANPKVVQKIMGHATIAMTFDTTVTSCRTGLSRRPWRRIGTSLARKRWLDPQPSSHVPRPYHETA